MSTLWKRALKNAYSACVDYEGRPVIQHRTKFDPLLRGMKSDERIEGERLKRRCLSALVKLAQAGDALLIDLAEKIPSMRLKVVGTLKDKTTVFSYREEEVIMQGYRMPFFDQNHHGGWRNFQWSENHIRYDLKDFDGPFGCYVDVEMQRIPIHLPGYTGRKNPNRATYKTFTRGGDPYGMQGARYPMEIHSLNFWYAEFGKEVTSLALSRSEEWRHLPLEIKKLIHSYLW